MSDYLTVSDIERATGDTYRTIDHALRTYGPEPRDRIGSARVWNRSDLSSIIASLQRAKAASTRERRVLLIRVDRLGKYVSSELIKPEDIDADVLAKAEGGDDA